MKPPHPLRTRRAAGHRVIAAALLHLLMACLTHRAAAEFIRPDTAGSLVFCIEQHPGKGGWLIAKLNGSGAFVLYGSPQATRGSLPAAESRRIFEEFEKLCTAAGLDFSRPPPPRVPPPPPPPPPGMGLGKTAAFINYASPQGRVLELRGAAAPLPPQLIHFVRVLWQKLLYHTTKAQHPPATPDPAPTPAPPVPANLR